MVIIGVDPGLTRCGIGVIEVDHRRQLRLLGVGVLRSAPDVDLAVRLWHLEQGLIEWFDAYPPDAVAVERVFAQHNSMTVMATSQASAIPLLLAARRGVPATQHTPSEIKAAVSGSGRADKAQVGQMVKRILRLDAAPTPADAADALALAICHAWRGPATNRYAAAVAAQQNRRDH